MKKLLHIFSLFFVFTAFIYPQQVFDSVTVSDQVGHSKALYFGLDPNGTDGIDVSLGESLLPPPPPTGAFDARLYLPANGFSGSSASWKDYRSMPQSPFSGVKEFRFWCQLGTGSPGEKVSWNFPSYLTGVLQDIITGTIINVPMSGTGTYNVIPGIFVLKMMVTYVNAVPVELTSFSASVQGRTVVLNWQTATETNNKGFQVERKSINKSWENIGFINGVGTSTSVHSYSYSDNISSSGLYTYRLKQVDLNGGYSYSKEVNADVNLSVSSFALNQNYPNPFNPTTAISFSVPNAGSVKIAVYDILGNEVKILFDEEAQAGTYNTMWNGLNSSGIQMSSGTYIYKMTAGEFVQSKKMILMK